MKKALPILIASIAFLLAVLTLSYTYIKKFRVDDTIMVTGLGKKNFESDLIVWSGTFGHKSKELKWAYAALKNSHEVVKEYLVSKGINESEIVFSSVDIDRDYNTWYDKDENYHKEFVGFELSQTVTIESSEVDKVEKVSREVTEIINQGIEFYSDQPSYYYTQLEELKLKMIEEASKNARLRAEIIANNSGAKLGKLRYSKMGVFQIIGKNSNEEYSYGGAFNTSSKEKTATITVKLNFGVN